MINSPKQDSEFIQTGGSFVKETLKILLIALVIVLPIRLFIAQPFIVSGTSMSPTFGNGDYLIVDQISYRFEEPERLDVVIFRYPKDPSKFFIKRIIGLPSETLLIDNGMISISLDGNNFLLLQEPYVLNTRRDNLKITLEEDEYFVMGDNRTASSDSRIWGPLKENLLVGRAFIRLLPVTKVGFSPGEFK